MADIPYGSLESASFVTNVGLITSKGDNGDNVMSAEWTHHISYSPGMIAVSINNGNKSTAKSIVKSKVFGVSIASDNQNILVSTAGSHEGYLVDKIAALKELGFKFTRGERTGVYLVDDSVLQLECKLVNTVGSGDHTLFVGEVVSIKHLGDKKPLVMCGGKFWKFGEQIHKPAQVELDKIKKVFEKHIRK